MIHIPTLLVQSLEKVWITFSHNWPFLLVSVLISVAMRLYVRPETVSRFLTRYSRMGVLGATAAAVTTPFCSCGTTAIILGMLASTIPWAPIVAFMVASPLTSPQELIYSAGLFGWPFAIAFFVSSIFLGLLGGAAAEWLEARGWLANQARFHLPPVSAAVPQAPQPGQKAACACQANQMALSPMPAPTRQALWVERPQFVASPALASQGCCGSTPVLPVAPSCGSSAIPSQPPAASCGCGGSANSSQLPAAKPQENKAGAINHSPITLRQWLTESYRTGKQLLMMFVGFAFIGYVLNGLIPQAWVSAVFGQGNGYSVPLAAILGLPLYINSEGSLPLIRALIDSGMSQGAALAFLITGSGTSVGAIAGAMTIARWHVIALVVGTLCVGAIAMGYLYDLALAVHLF